MTWYRHDAARGVLVLQIQAQPGAKHQGCAPHGDDLLKVRVKAKPVDGEANAALCAYLAQRLGVAPSAVRLVRGATSRRKCVEVALAEFDPRRLLDADAEGQSGV